MEGKVGVVSVSLCEVQDSPLLVEGVNSRDLFLGENEVEEVSILLKDGMVCSEYLVCD